MVQKYHEWLQLVMVVIKEGISSDISNRVTGPCSLLCQKSSCGDIGDQWTNLVIYSSNKYPVSYTCIRFVCLIP